MLMEHVGQKELTFGLSVTAEQYQAAFDREAAMAYPVVDAFEQACGFALDAPRLLAAARVLACPLKANPPNWQHGRVLYALTRRYLSTFTGFANLLDIGTAKGFSALCLQWALEDSGLHGDVASVDVVSPDDRVRRNTVAELGGFLTLEETLRPWPEARAVKFMHMSGIHHLENGPRRRLNVVFVDGKHDGYVVRREGVLIAHRQQTDDVVLFDDVHLPDVSVAVNTLLPFYAIKYLEVLPKRHYAIATRR